MEKAKIYISSPYSVGDIEASVERQIATASLLIEAGCNPYVPILNRFIYLRWKKNEEVLLSLNFKWLIACDAVYRLQGNSTIADREVEIAKSKKIPVLYSMMEVLDFIWLHKRQQIKKKEKTQNDCRPKITKSYMPPMRRRPPRTRSRDASS